MGIFLPFIIVPLIANAALKLFRTWAEEAHPEWFETEKPKNDDKPKRQPRYELGDDGVKRHKNLRTGG